MCAGAPGSPSRHRVRGVRAGYGRFEGADRTGALAGEAVRAALGRPTAAPEG